MGRGARNSNEASVMVREQLVARGGNGGWRHNQPSHDMVKAQLVSQLSELLEGFPDQDMRPLWFAASLNEQGSGWTLFPNSDQATARRVASRLPGMYTHVLTTVVLHVPDGGAAEDAELYQADSDWQHASSVEDLAAPQWPAPAN